MYAEIEDMIEYKFYSVKKVNLEESQEELVCRS